jgi:hypothetical protein
MAHKMDSVQNDPKEKPLGIILLSPQQLLRAFGA